MYHWVPRIISGLSHRFGLSCQATMAYTTSGNSRFAGKAARNCATGCTHCATRGRRPIHTPTGTQTRLASAISTTTRAMVSKPEHAHFAQLGEIGPGPQRLHRACAGRACRRSTAAWSKALGRSRSSALRRVPVRTRGADAQGQGPAGPAHQRVKNHRQALDQAGAPHHGQRPGRGWLGAGFLLDAKAIDPGDHRAKQQLVIHQDDQAPSW